jgi:hypothetical protein
MLLASQRKTIFSPQTSGLITLVINRCGKTIEVTFRALYLFNNTYLGKFGGLDAVNLGNFADFLHVHNRFLHR